MFSLARFRFVAIFLSLLTAFAVVTVDSAEARRFGGGGSLGSRGTKTFQSVPPTKTSPSVTAPAQKPAANAATQAQGRNTAPNPGIFSGGLMRGLFLGGLFGLFLGTGFGGMAGMLSLLFQVALVGLVLWFLFGRRRMATAGGPAGYGAPPQSAPSPFSGTAKAAATRPLEVTAADLDIFEDRLGQLQNAYSREDEAELARLTTPELRRQLSQELADLAEKGLRNEVYDVKMLSGSVAEAWREGSRDFATVALRYESRDVLRERATGRLVSGSEALSEATEIWTFVRDNGGDWRLSAMQDA